MPLVLSPVLVLSVFSLLPPVVPSLLAVAVPLSVLAVASVLMAVV
jgi:hypothetical protein